MKPLKERYSLSLDSDLAEAIKKMAEDDDRSFSQFVNMILKDYLQKNNSKTNDSNK